MSNRQGYAIRDQFGIYFLTFQIVGWIDVFTRKRYKDFVIDSFKYCQVNKSLNVHAWVIMSNHIHCVLSSDNGKLSDGIRDLKKYTSKRMIESMESDLESRKQWMLHQFKYFASLHKRNMTYQVWTHDNHPVQLENEMFDQRINYIHMNPVKAGKVRSPEEYVYSSAIDYYTGVQGLIKLNKIS